MEGAITEGAITEGEEVIMEEDGATTITIITIMEVDTGA